MSLATGQRLGGFEVLGPLGSGGMGEVYRARDTRLGREVALKVLPESLASDRDRLARFEQEARAASALNHPNIVTIYEIGRDGDTTFVAMELVDGRTLRELVVSGPMPVKKVLNVAAQISEGLAKAHGAGIVHRDLKPENVMVSKDGFVKILDFGLAKLTEPQTGQLSAMPTLGTPQTTAGTVLGTVAYMSPEQASGDPVDCRSDQFSLGSMLYELSTGKKAFQRKTAAETMSAIIREEPEPAGKLRPDLPLPVRWILDRCMAKDPEDRYAATRDLARDFSGLRDHISEASSGSGALSPSTARPRRRGALVAAAAVLLAAAAVLAGRWSVRPAGPAAPVFHRLSFGREGIGNARFTSDGKTVVYGLFPGLGQGNGARLMFTREGNPESKAFDFPGDILSISKTDEMAVFQQGPGRAGLGTAAVASLTGGSPRPLVADVVWAGADWDPAGKGLAVLRSGAAGPVALEFPINRRLLEGRLEAVRFSRDGSRLAVFSEGSEGVSLVVLDRDGKNRKDVSSGWFALGGLPNWHPNGEIWFTARKGGDDDSLWATTLSGQLRVVTRVPGTLELYDIAPDGRILLGHHTQIRTIRGVSASDGSEGELSWLDNSLPSDLSADGTTLLITEIGAGAGEGPAFYTRTTDRTPATRISDGWGLALSADKKWVLAQRREAGKWRLWLVPTGTGDSRPIATGGYGVTGGAFIAGTSKILFSTDDPDGRSRLYTVDTSVGKAVPIPGGEEATISLFSSPVSPDGNRILASRHGAAVVLPIAGGDAKPIPGLSVPGFRVPQWSADSSSVYAFTPTGRSLDVELVNVETGARQSWKHIPIGSEDWRQFRLRITPNGRVWVYAAAMVTSELYVVEGLR